MPFQYHSATRRTFGLVLALTAGFLSGAQTTPAPSSSPEIALSVTGDVASPLALAEGDFANFPRQSVTVEEHGGGKATYEGVPLLLLLQKAGAPLGTQLKGKTMASYVLAVARDGYEVIFSLAELDPAFRDSTVIVADRRDGKPMSNPLGPLRIVAATDKKPARSIRMLEKLQVVLLRP